MSASPEPSAPTAPHDPLRQAAPAVDDVEARRARASIASRLFSGPPQPVRVGRYRIEGRIGAGGMGVVYRAHDPELARDVAVKLMNAESAGSDSTTARARLVREARAMARLAHPNVLHVYDVGTTDDGVFIAMELVEGCSLGKWLKDESPPWREILRCYVAAGRGLAAAHDAGVIHRDFKPENVLLGSDGRVRVGDFGLAGGPAATEHASTESQLDRDSGDLNGPSGSLTKTGTLLGTPKYMAPEQESGTLAGAASDQFSFCVALYEALYGYPPFAGTSVAEYRHNVHDGHVLDPPPDSKVRGWVHAVIVRGLAVDPAERHPALEPLLDRLEEALIDPSVARRSRRRRNRAAGIIAALVSFVLVGALAMVLTRDDDPVAPPSSTLAQGPSLTPGAPAIAESEAPAQPDPAPEPTTSTPAGDSAANEAIVAGSTTGPEPAADPDALPVAAPPGSTTASTTASTDGGGDQARPAVKRKRKSGTCYFQQDKFNLIERRRKHSRFVTGKNGRCYDCQQEAPDYRRAQLIPSDCARYYLCVRTGEELCTG